MELQYEERATSFSRSFETGKERRVLLVVVLPLTSSLAMSSDLKAALLGKDKYMVLESERLASFKGWPPKPGHLTPLNVNIPFKMSTSFSSIIV